MTKIKIIAIIALPLLAFSQKKVEGILTQVILLFLGMTFAQEKNKKMTMEVDGKCDMCKMRNEKAALG